jgi:hypothetical protein
LNSTEDQREGCLHNRAWSKSERKRANKPDHIHRQAEDTQDDQRIIPFNEVMFDKVSPHACINSHRDYRIAPARGSARHVQHRSQAARGRAELTGANLSRLIDSLQRTNNEDDAARLFQRKPEALRATRAFCHAVSVSGAHSLPFNGRNSAYAHTTFEAGALERLEHRSNRLVIRRTR